jgi:hypothetical protein
VRGYRWVPGRHPHRRRTAERNLLISDKGDLIAMGVWAAIIGVGGYALFGPAIAAVAVIVYIVVMGERRR